MADTSIWIDHLRVGDGTLAALLDNRGVVTHPFVIGELALGNLQQREIIIRSLSRLPQVSVAKHDEVLAFIEAQKLFGIGIGYVDAHLLAAIRLSPDALLWTRDKRLRTVAERLTVCAKLE